MANPRSTKRDIDKAKRERAAEKRERRQSPKPAPDASGVPVAPPPSATNDDVLLELAELHARFEADGVDFDDFERAKAALLARLATG